jgi:hypothetical protein
MISELKNIISNEKVNYRSYLQLQQIKYQLYLIYGLRGKHDLSYSCVTVHYIDHDWILQKKNLKFLNHRLFAHRTNYLSIYYKMYCMSII